MRRLAALLAAAAGLAALPATAAADSVLTVRDGQLIVLNDDAGVGNEFTIEARGDRVYITDPKDPQGMQTNSPESCQASQLNGAGVTTQINCAKSAISKGVVIESGPGEDTIKHTVTDIPLSAAGATGADRITSSEAGDDLSGEQGNDALASGGGDDILNGDDGSDTLDAGAGNDQLVGGTGTDTFTAGAGDDRVSAADGLTEKIDCGDGTDTVTADTQDELVGCENVTRQNITGVAPDDTTNDKTAPKVQVGGADQQKAGKSVRFVATCSEKGIVNAVAFLDASGLNSALKPAEAKIPVGGGGVKVALKFSSRHMKYIRSDLRKRRKPRVRVTISCVDPAGNTSRPRRFWISLRR